MLLTYKKITFIGTLEYKKKKKKLFLQKQKWMKKSHNNLPLFFSMSEAQNFGNHTKKIFFFHKIHKVNKNTAAE